MKEKKGIEMMSGVMTELNEIASLIFYQAKDSELDGWLRKVIKDGWWEPAHDTKARSELINSIARRSHLKEWDTPRK
jgi:hypothetical protein|tara:strand:- start:34 stop:264 length:231 start_codon:yes stop_codon:yes gene_type:complete